MFITAVCVLFLIKPNLDFWNYMRSISETFQETIAQEICQKKVQLRARG